MKTQVSTPVVVVVILVVVGIACFFGFRHMGFMKSSRPTLPAQDYASRMRQMNEKQMSGTAQGAMMGGSGGMAGGSGSMMQRYRQQQQGGGR